MYHLHFQNSAARFLLWLVHLSAIVSRDTFIHGEPTCLLFVLLLTYMPSDAVRAFTHIDEGYSMILTEAPNDFGGRLFRNCALTTPELPL